MSKGQAKRRELTATSYAILGLLALRSWSSYELAKQIPRALGRFWPRAESNIYAEPKRLVAAGLATADTHWVGERSRTVYAITERGREALRDWLGRPAGSTRFESEPLLKVFYADQGTHEDLLAHLAGIADDARESKHWAAQIAREHMAGAAPFLERSHLGALVFRLLWAQYEATERWAEWATAEVSEWPSVVASSDRKQVERILAEMLDSQPAR